MVKDGVLVAVARFMVRARRQDTVRVIKVKRRHATEADVVGNAEADAAADLGRRHQSEEVMDVRRALLNAREFWYPILLQSQLFTIAVSRVAVHHDGRSGSAPDPLDWDAGSRTKQRKVDVRVNVDLASLLGPPGFLDGPWVHAVGGCVTGADVDAWPHSVSMLCKFTAFLGTLQWSAGAEGIGHFGVSFLKGLILFEQWAGHRLLSEKVTPPHVRANRPILITSVLVSEGFEIRLGCQLIRSLVRALGKLPRGIGRFLPCRVRSHMSRLQHIGGGNSVRMRYLPESCHISVLKRSVGVWVIQLVQLRSFWMVRSSSAAAPRFFSDRFLSKVLPWHGYGAGKLVALASRRLLEGSGNV